MAGGLYLLEDVLDLAVGGDDEGRPGDAHVGFAVHRLFHPDAVGFGAFGFGVGQEGEGEGVLGLELRLRLSVSGEMPMMMASLAAKSAVWSRNSQDSVVQPGVSALG